MRIFVFPGSFDPITNGHLDIINRASKLCDKLIVAVLTNSSKTFSFTVDERVSFIRRTTATFDNVEVDSFGGLLVDYAKLKDVSVILKGLRTNADFEMEHQMALLNKQLDSRIESMFLMSDNNFTYISSSFVRDFAKNGASLKGFVPEILCEDIRKRFI